MGRVRESERFMRACVVQGCARSMYGHGFCSLHYQRWRRTGDPLCVRTLKGKPPWTAIRARWHLTPAERFWTRVQCNLANGCWEFQGKPDTHGYGQVSWQTPSGKTMLKAHHLGLILSGTHVPAGTCVLHHCDNPPCVRPDHLWFGTRSENSRDMKTKGRWANQFQRGPAYVA